MNKKYYAIGAIERKHSVSFSRGEISIPLIWTDGMVGVLPVFSDKKKAEKYAGKDFNVFAFTVDKTQNKRNTI